MTNFDFLKSDKQFEAIADAAIAAENVLHIDRDSCVLSCRRAMELAVKWMYSVDKALKPPYQDNLVTMINDRDFRDIVGTDIWRRMDFIRKMGNVSAHEDKKITLEQAELCLENLFVFLDFVACCYGKNYTRSSFRKELLELTPQEALGFAGKSDINLEKLMEENKALKEELTARRAEQQQTYVPNPLALSEFGTRKIYIDAMLADAGWQEGKDWLSDFELPGLPGQSEKQVADYVLLGSDNVPLAVIEAKRTIADAAKGRQQAKLYADILEQKYHRRPVIFLTDGFETRITDNIYPERRCAAVYSKGDLKKLFTLQASRTSPIAAAVNKTVAGRGYQEEAVKAVCNAFDSQHRRKALLAMAAGSGKTRTVFALCDVLLKHGWVKNILFLSDKENLVAQAKRSFEKVLPDVSVTNLCEKNKNYTARCVFSSYQAMYEAIDGARGAGGRIYTSGHFDLVICDEAHRSVLNKYRDIFTYFDAFLVGLTATPKDEINKETYEAFEQENGEPTYCYSLSQAVKDGYLVPFEKAETRLGFREQGVAYDELPEDEKQTYEDTFGSENGELSDVGDSSAFNEWIFDGNTVREALRILMTDGLKIDYGNKLGKTIIFAKNRSHAEKICEVFRKEYPQLPGFAAVMDDRTDHGQSALDDFRSPEKLPQIAVSAGMLDTGVDVPGVLNLVFFKKVMSKARFRQMIGRGARPCRNLMDGRDKETFRIFDFCGNFEFFRMNHDAPASGAVSLTGEVFRLKSQLAFKLQDFACQTPELIALRQSLVQDMVKKVRELNRENFAVRQHLKYVETYADSESYELLSCEDTLLMGQELAPLITPDDDDAKTLRFDVLVYAMELARLAGKKYDGAGEDLLKVASAIASVTDVPEITAQSGLLEKIRRTGYAESAGIPELEHIRKSLRGLMKHVPPAAIHYTTNPDDDILLTD